MSAGNAPRSPSIDRNPRLGDWLSFEPSGQVAVYSGKVELGQGILTALSQIVAEELEIEPSRVIMRPARTGASPDEGYTTGSMSVAHSGSALREVASRVKAIFLAEAAEELFCPPDTLSVADGRITAPYGGWTSYWALSRDGLLDIDMRHLPAPRAKDPARYRIVGRSTERLDSDEILFGAAHFIHDIRLPHMLFGRVIKPPALVANLIDVDPVPAGAIPGVVRIVHEANFLGVIAECEATAVRAADVLRRHTHWETQPSLPALRGLDNALTAADSEPSAVYRTGQPAGEGVETIARTFSRGYIAHASLAPSCGIAVWSDSGLLVWSHTQGIYGLRAELARDFGLDESRVTVQHANGAGCYGHNGADDAAYDAALLAQSVPGRAVHLVWSRQDEFAWEPFGPAAVVEIRAIIDENARPTHWSVDAWGSGHDARPNSTGHPPLLGRIHRSVHGTYAAASDPDMSYGGGLARNAVPLYEIPGIEVTTHRLTAGLLRTSALRALGAHINVYAIESMIDELATSNGIDPLAYRLSLLKDARARAVLHAAADRSGWGAAIDHDQSRGRGLGFARYKNSGAYCAVVAEVEAIASVRVTRLTIAVDVGLVINPDGVVNQIEGGALQAVSWTTLEQIKFDRLGVTSQDWTEYPILAFDHVPSVEVVIVNRPDAPPVGSGEAAAGPTAAAIGNALADATGLRVRKLPVIPENIIGAIS